MIEHLSGRRISIRDLRPFLRLWPLALLTLAGCAQDYRDRDLWPLCALPDATSTDGVAWLSPTDQRSVLIGGSPVFTADHWVSAITPTPDGAGFLVLGDGETTLLVRAGDGWDARPLGTAPSRVRAAASDRSGALVLITGGQTQPAERRTESVDEPTPWLMGARACAGTLDAGLLLAEPDLPAEWNPWRLRPGRFAGEDNVLIFVYKRSPFDAVARKRPFIFRVVSSAGSAPRLEPRWRGSAFSHPFVDADFGDFTGSGQGEVAALEVARDGGRLLTAYHFEGFGLEGLAPTVELPEVQDRLMTADVWGDERAEMIVLTAGDSPALVAWGLTDAEEPELVEVARTDLPGQVIAWTIVADRAVWLRADGGVGETQL